jgi:hypothetical protein
LPSGYKASSVPKSESIRNEVWGFELEYKAAKETVTLSQKFDIDQLLIQPSDFEKWNKVLESLLPHYNQTIVLSKN